MLPSSRRPSALLSLLLALGVGCTDSSRPLPEPRPTTRPHVLILALDACRADKFSAYGLERPTTPAFDALAAEPESVLFEWQIVQAPHTKASTASLFTGVYPFQHGVVARDDLTEVLSRGGSYGGRHVLESYQTLAESFSAAGYRTYAHPHIGHLTAKSGFAQGFGEFLDPARRANRGADEAKIDRVVDYLGAADQPAFAYVHLFGCHNPFPHARRDADYFARYGAGFDEAALTARGVEVGEQRVKWAVREGRLRLDQEAVDYLNAVYESVLRRVDRTAVARLVDGLRAAGVFDRTLLVVTADHGEELYEHGGYAHGATVWNEVVRVPLVVKFPRGARPALPRRVSRVTQAIDLYPGLLRAVGVEPPPGLAGRDLFDPAALPAPVFTEAPGSWALIEWPLKVVVFASPPRAALFDLAADPLEKRDLAAERRRDLSRLVRLGEGLQSLLPRQGAAVPQSEVVVDPETLEELKSLGYIQ